MENLDIGLWLFGGANVFAWIYFGRAFVNGEIFSKNTVDRIMTEAQNMTTKLAKEVGKDIQTSVKMGVIEAFSEMNGTKSSKSSKK